MSSAGERSRCIAALEARDPPCARTWHDPDAARCVPVPGAEAGRLTQPPPQHKGGPADRSGDATRATEQALPQWAAHALSLPRSMPSPGRFAGSKRPTRCSASRAYTTARRLATSSNLTAAVSSNRLWSGRSRTGPPQARPPSISSAAAPCLAPAQCARFSCDDRADDGQSTATGAGDRATARPCKQLREGPWAGRPACGGSGRIRPISSRPSRPQSTGAPRSAMLNGRLKR